MAPEVRPEDAGLNAEPRQESFAPSLSQLRETPWDFRFFQAVRLLESAADESAGVGHFQDPAREAVRFGVKPSLAFPPSEIASIDWDQSPPRMTVQCLALTGPNGALPLVYTDFLEERERTKDPTAREFLDLFHHRALSLFYRAWLKHQIAPSEESSAAIRFRSYLAALVGMGSPLLRDRQCVDDLAFFYYSGLLALQPRSALALEQLLTDYFDVPVEVEPLSGGWFQLPRSMACVLEDESEDAGALGFGALAGTEYWDPNSRARIRLGPLGPEKYDWFLPGHEGYRALADLVRFFSRGEVDFDIQLVLKREAVPRCVLGGQEAEYARLGWTTWIKSGDVFDRNPDDTIVQLPEGEETR